MAKELALPYVSSTLVDTIVCMDETEVIGAYLADYLLRSGRTAINSDREINIITPIRNVNKKLTFQSDIQHLIKDRDVILLLSTVTGGSTLRDALEALSYYGGKVVGISTLFNAYPEEQGLKINTMFTRDDLFGYELYKPGECPLCEAGAKIDAIIVHDGYIETEI